MCPGIIMEKINRLFYTYGKVCATHPSEVMFAFFTLFFTTLFSLSTRMDNHLIILTTSSGHRIQNSDLEGASVFTLFNIILMIFRCLAIFYVYNQFENIYGLGSKYLVRISALFIAFSCFVYCSAVLFALNANFNQLNDTLPFIFLLTDLNKVSLFAQLALTSYSKMEVIEQIAQGMALIGPTLTVDTLVKTLILGLGCVSGVKQLVEISCFVCFSVLVNYVVFMSIFPAFLSIAPELLNKEDDIPPVSQNNVLQTEKTVNPLIQRIKLIMSAVLVLVHLLSRWHMNSNYQDHKKDSGMVESLLGSSISEEVLMIVAVFALVVKYMLFENEEHLEQNNDEIQHKVEKSVLDNDDCIVRPLTPIIILTTEESDTESIIHDNSQLTITEENVSSKGSVKGDVLDEELARTFYLGGDSSSEISDNEFNDREIEMNENPNECQTVCEENKQMRDIETLMRLYQSENGVNQLTDLEIKYMVEGKHIPSYNLESVLGDEERGVSIRRTIIEASVEKKGVLESVPFTHFDYSLVFGACCENVIGYIPVPLGVAGPMILNKKRYMVPMATTEGCLVASANRGCRAIFLSGGANSSVYSDGMTRGPVVHFPTAMRAVEALKWLQIEENFRKIKEVFDSTSRFARLLRIHPRVAGRYLYIRFIGFTGDAMGMNMMTKGTEVALKELTSVFQDVQVSYLSGNVCTDKKASAVNWIEGRGKSVICEAVIRRDVIENVLKTSVEALVELNISKNLIGSAIAGTLGGNNAHAANIVAAIYIACGQDPAQTIGSSNCITLMEAHGGDLRISCSMPSIEVGTIGGGTVLKAQGACLELLGVKGCSLEMASNNSCELASIVCATVLAAELSVMSSLAAGHLVRSHMKHNRSNININATVPHSMSFPLFNN